MPVRNDETGYTSSTCIKTHKTPHTIHKVVVKHPSSFPGTSWRKAIGFFFFFQAEDGIRDRNVTGDQTCALPILRFARSNQVGEWHAFDLIRRRRVFLDIALQRPMAQLIGELEALDQSVAHLLILRLALVTRSEERRVGKECRARWGGEQ